MVQSLLPPQVDNSQAVQYRSGVAARLAGLPVETLRVWERRYGISDTGRSAHGQRLYSEDQVRRLRLMKQLVDQGHPIGALAKLQLEQLGQFALVPEPGVPMQPLRLALMGAALARRLAVGGRELLALDIVANFQNLDDAAAAWAGTGAQLLLMEISELDEHVVPAICALRQTLGMALVVLYRFGASATIRQLRAQGCLVARVPSDVAEIVLLCQAALAALPLAQAQLARQRPAAPVPRRFDDRALAELAAASSTVHCECPRHLTDILLMINSFERYSEQCSSRNVADALLHEQLGHAAATARMVLEEALLRLARAEALPLPAGL
ncbi:MerR-like DNA binding protein [Janthinobacterium sp. 61]|uniref:MerR family transcriptional regulator n=1 Tax=Janthinobacterium sp. 61 TaxID=2035209 RepID=UPI000C7130A8|nr:MerR family transcriptional regulator [Janthinobacterium sp. 61]PKV44422.1 MerR-like DNA binding protein [Janthinobacterium sp. 61]